MKVVLDEGVPRSLAGALRVLGLDADPFDPAWIGLRNGVLLRRVAAAGYAVLLTNDKNIAFQQSLKGARVAVVALPLNRRSAVLARAADIAETIRRAAPGRHLLMNLDGTRTMRGFEGDRLVVADLPPVPTFKG